jgi:hypothetical protein
MKPNAEAKVEPKKPWSQPAIERIGTFGQLMQGPTPGDGDGASGMMQKL